MIDECVLADAGGVVRSRRDRCAHCHSPADQAAHAVRVTLSDAAIYPCYPSRGIPPATSRGSRVARRETGGSRCRGRRAGDAGVRLRDTAAAMACADREGRGHRADLSAGQCRCRHNHPGGTGWSFVNSVFRPSARVADGIRDAAMWLDRQPPASREIVIVGTLREGSLSAADIAIAPSTAGIRFVPVDTPAAPRDVDFRACWTTPGHCGCAQPCWNKARALRLQPALTRHRRSPCSRRPPIRHLPPRRSMRRFHAAFGFHRPRLDHCGSSLPARRFLPLSQQRRRRRSGCARRSRNCPRLRARRMERR